MSQDTGLEDLKKRIHAASVQQQQKGAPRASTPVSSTRVGVELMAGIAVGTVGGYYLDRWLDTLPIFFILGFVFGVAAGGLNIYKLATREQKEDVPKKYPPST